MLLRAAIFDFGGVLTTPLQDALMAFGEDAGIELQDLVRACLGAYAGQQDDLVTGFETGLISEEEFSVAVAGRLSEISGRQLDPRGLVQRMFRVSLEEQMFDAIGTAHAAGLRTALLSNSWGTSLYPRRRLADLFDVLVMSGEVGLRKPEPAIFALTVERLGVAPGECVFVDDNPSHLAVAKEQGMATVLHRSPEDSISELEVLLDLRLR
jgi:putative hydrolase of the HAD superfamily